VRFLVVFSSTQPVDLCWEVVPNASLVEVGDELAS
jgi:hypothetical protein